MGPGGARGVRARSSGSGSTAGWPDSGSTSRTACTRTRSCATTRRKPSEGPLAGRFGQRAVYSMNRPEIARGVPGLAADRGQLPGRRGCCSARPGWATWTGWPATTATTMSCSWRSTSRSCSPRSPRRTCPVSWRRPWPGSRPGRARCGRRRTTTSAGSPSRWCGGGRAEDPAGPAGAGHPAGHPGALLRRRDRDDRRGCPARAAAGRDVTRRESRLAGQPGPRPNPDAVGCHGQRGIRAGRG